MRSLVLYLRALGAALALAGIVFGIPLLLTLVIGNPLPTWDALQVGDFSDDTLLHILATLAWLGWASLVATLVVEARAQAIDQPAPSLPVLPGQQDLARSLIAALLLAAPTIAVTATVTHHPAPAPETLDPLRPAASAGQHWQATAAPTRHHAQTQAAPVPSRQAPDGHQAERLALQAISEQTGLGQTQAHRTQSAPTEAEPVSLARTYLLGAGSGAGTALAATGLHRILRRRRRQQHATRAPGHLLAPLPSEAARIERQLLASSWAAETLRERLQSALDHLDVALSAHGRDPAHVLAARLDTERIDVLPSTERETAQPPPAPWVLDPVAGLWTLPASAHLDTLDAAATSTPEPIHRSWAWIGSSPGPRGAMQQSQAGTDVWLLNLSASGGVRIIGEPAQSAALVSAMLLSLPESPGDSATAPTRTASRISVHSDAADLKELADLLGAEHHALDAAHTARDAHGRHPNRQAGAVALIDERPRTSSLTAPGNSLVDGAIPLVLSEDLTELGHENVRLVFDTTGQLHVSFRPSPLHPAALHPGDLAWIRPLLLATPPATQRTAPWASTAGSTSTPRHTPERATALVLEPDPPKRTSTPGRPTDSAPQARRNQPHDPHLDEDLRQWHAETTDRPRLRLLGPIEVRVNGTPPPNGRMAWWCEIVTLLYAHPEGLLPDDFVEKLWPRNASRKVSTAMPRQAISTVRNWLGTNPETGQYYLPRLRPNDTSDAYRIEHLLTDADLAQRLYLRWTRRNDEGIHDLQAALDLVTGTIMEHRRRTGYLWLLDIPLLSDLNALITDAAHALAAHHLGRGEAEQAMSAARTAVRAGSFDDTTHLDLIAAAEMLGHHSDARYWLEQLLDTHDVTAVEELPTSIAGRLFSMRKI